jgi:hypothetical protein
MSLMQLLHYGQLGEFYLYDKKHNDLIKGKYVLFNKCKNNFTNENKFDYLPKTVDNSLYIYKLYISYIKENEINLDLVTDENKKIFIKTYFHDCIPNSTDNLLAIDELYEKYKF